MKEKENKSLEDENVVFKIEFLIFLTTVSYVFFLPFQIYMLPDISQFLATYDGHSYEPVREWLFSLEPQKQLIFVGCWVSLIISMLFLCLFIIQLLEMTKYYLQNNKRIQHKAR